MYGLDVLSSMVWNLFQLFAYFLVTWSLLCRTFENQSLT